MPRENNILTRDPSNRKSAGRNGRMSAEPPLNEVPDERSDIPGVNEAALLEMFPLVYESGSGEHRIFAVSREISKEVNGYDAFPEVFPGT